LVLDLVSPRRVVDVGCGMGSWLVVCKEHGITDVLGIDGYVDRTWLKIPEDQFFVYDLRQPLRLDRQFDLAISVEVACNLPAECAETFVDSLARLAPVILFSAGVPFQRGWAHLNEQWPDYWVRRFKARGYVPVDILRQMLWEEDSVSWYYAQNMVFFVREQRLADYPKLRVGSTRVPALVHPRHYQEKVEDLARAGDPTRIPLRKVLAALPIIVKNSVMWRVNALLGREP
jgi:SAM-dependent methyltransferase